MHDMKLHLSEEPIAALAELARIPIAFEVKSVFDVTEQSDHANRFLLSEHRLAVPCLKDYDSIEGNGPATWASRFDVSHWGLIGAYAESRRVGAAVIACHTPGLDLLEGRADLAVLWDIRVLPHFRGKGIGAALFRSAEAWSGKRGCRQLRVETQNINVPACRFYARQGCSLERIDRSAYPDFPDEIQLLWSKDIVVAPNAR